MPKHDGQALVSALARRFNLPAKARARPLTAKRPARHHSEPKPKKRRRANDASQAPESVQLEDEEAADKSDAQIGPASETDVEHLARHNGGRNGCPRCKLLGCEGLQSVILRLTFQLSSVPC